MKKHTSAFFAAAALVALAACGSSDAGPTYATAADSATIDLFAQDAGDIAQSALFNVFDNGGMNIGFAARPAGAGGAARGALQYALALGTRSALRHSAPLPRSSVAPIQFSAPFSQCTPVETGVDQFGVPIDTDADGISDDYKVNFGSACVSEDSAGTYRVTISGSIRIEDTGLGFFSFRVTAANLKVVDLDLTTGDSFTFSMNGFETATFTAALASHSQELGVRIAATSGSTTTSIAYTDNEDASFDPDAGSSLAIATPLPAGIFDFTADYRIVGENSGGQVAGNFRFQLSTPTPLHYNPACVFDIDAGVFRGLLNGNSNVGFTLTWTSCANPVRDIFGNTP